MALRGGIPGILSSGFRNLADSASSAIDSTVNEDTVRLAVTGLSRAGKTVFITSMIQNLLALGAGRDTLPKLTKRLSKDGRSRLRGVHLMPAGAATVPLFDQAANLAVLASEAPAWPERTQDIAQVSLAIEVDRRSSAGRLLGSRRVRLDILDYPGEWLLDLPLLDQSFTDWSTRTLDMLRQQPRREHAEKFLGFLDRAAHAGDTVSEILVREGHTLYREALLACRAHHGLRYLQPGRFVCPGPRSDAPFLWFFPIDIDDPTPERGTMAALLAERFETYKDDMRRNFFDTHFASFNRQVVLVDVLSAIHAGKAAFDDTVLAIRELSNALRYGGRSWSREFAATAVRGASQLLPGILNRATDSAVRTLSNSRIERVAFVATKADHVPRLRRDNLRNLLRDFAGATGHRSQEIGAAVSYHVAAAILSTDDGTARIDGRPVEVVRGIKLGEDSIRPFFVGDVPSGLPPDTFWSDRYFEMPVFRPPPIDPTGTAGIRHLDLDVILDDLIGGLL